MNTQAFSHRLLILCGTLATSAVLGQTIYTWTGAADGTNLSTPGNWTTNGVHPATTLPDGNNGLGDGFQDRAQWDGRTGTNLLLVYNTTWPDTGFGSWGVNLVMMTNQTNAVQITTSLATSAGVGLNHVTNNSPNASFIMGDNGNNNWLVFGRPAGSVHHYLNNSTAPAIINPSVRWQAGGGSGYTYAFGGTGDWIVKNDLMDMGGAFSPIPVTVNGPGTVFWFGGRTGSYNPTSALGPVTINGGVLVIKTNGLFTGTANQPIVNHATFIYDAAAVQTLNGVISGNGALIVANGTLTLNAANTYTGTTTISNGTLIVNGINNSSTVVVDGTLGGTGVFHGPVTLNAGSTLAPGGLLGTLTFSNNLNIGGNLGFEVNKSFSPSNDFVVVIGTLTNTGAGTLTVTNLGPALVVGDKFTLFSKPLHQGAALTVTGAGAIWANHLDTDGSLSVTAVTVPALQFTSTGNSLRFSWNTSYGAYRIQTQTNSLAVGLSNDWTDYPGGSTSPMTVPMDATPATVFFRLVSP